MIQSSLILWCSTTYGTPVSWLVSPISVIICTKINCRPQHNIWAIIEPENQGVHTLNISWLVFLPSPMLSSLGVYQFMVFFRKWMEYCKNYPNCTVRAVGKDSIHITYSPSTLEAIFPGDDLAIVGLLYGPLHAQSVQALQRFCCRSRAYPMFLQWATSSSCGDVQLLWVRFPPSHLPASSSFFQTLRVKC